MSKWITTWAAAAIGCKQYSSNYGGRTVRCFVPVAYDCEAVRIRLNNIYGKHSAKIAKMTVICGEKALPVLFDSKESLVLKKGSRISSDEVRISRKAGEQIEIRMYLKSRIFDCSTGLLPCDHSAKGDFTSGDFTAENSSCWCTKKRPMEIPAPMPLVSSVDILTESEKSAIAVFGASNEFSGAWVNPFAERVKAEQDRPVLNLGISGNRLLRDTGIPLLIGSLFGDAGLKRIEWDMLDLSNVGTAILQLCGNDVFQPGTFAAPAKQLPTVQEIKDGIAKFAAMCKEKGIKTVALTVTPCAGADGIDEKKLAMLKEINDWLREGNACDECFDFNSVCRDPENPDAYLPEYDSGDHVHLNKACGKAVAEAFDLSLL